MDGFSYRANLYLLSTIPEDLILGLYQEYQPVEEVSLILDGAGATTFENNLSGSLFFKGTAEYPLFDASLSLAYGSPFFPGALTDKYAISARLMGRIIPGIWELTSGYNQQQRNLLVDSARSSASLTHELFIKSLLKFPTFGTSLSA